MRPTLQTAAAAAVNRPVLKPVVKTTRKSAQAMKTVKKSARAALGELSLAIVLAQWPQAAMAHHGDPSEASAASGLSIAVSVSAPLMVPAAVLSAGAVLTVVSVQAVSTGTVWVLERVSDGARISLTLVGGSVVAAGTAVSVVATGAGWILSQAGRALCFIPNEIGASLVYNEPITR